MPDTRYVQQANRHTSDIRHLLQRVKSELHRLPESETRQLCLWLVKDALVALKREEKEGKA